MCIVLASNDIHDSIKQPLKFKYNNFLQKFKHKILKRLIALNQIKFLVYGIITEHQIKFIKFFSTASACERNF